MRIEVKGRGVQVTDELRECVRRRFDRVERQVSELAVLEVELAEEKVPGAAVAAEAELHLKGVTLRAKDSSKDVKHAINLVADEMARQVKRDRDKRRNRRQARTPVEPGEGTPAEPGGESVPAF